MTPQSPGVPARNIEGVETLSMAEDDLAVPAMTAPEASAPVGDAAAYDRIRDPKRYVILGEHGRGALGRVVRAHDKELGRDIAIKELIVRDPTSEARFLREALITARLEHPGIIAVHEAGRWPDGTPFYAMKLVSGRPLRELITERTTPEARLGLLHHVIAVADAMAYAHRRNIIHRDLKPGNVIAGEFGETVVIDWGLAKDLGAGEEINLADSQRRIGPDPELTAVGTVIGTRAYMAPEQERGERVDQRADVFAIGVMLWELCAPTRNVPSWPEDRDRVLRRAGIDPDLATIIQKALDPDPALRYPDAGTLANDLKAFKSGARIAARGYSLFGVLAHAIRRYRRLTFSIFAATLFAIAGATMSVVNIATERDRADIALVHLQKAIGDRVLEHAKVLLATDPTAARRTLRDYDGSDTVAVSRLIAEAEGRGVARAVLTPHSGPVWFLHGDQTGAILSVGQDRRIMLTRDGRSTTLAADVSADVRLAYSPSQRLLAYATAPEGLSLLDLRTSTRRRLSAVTPTKLAFSVDGARLATVDERGELRVWTTGTDARPSHHGTLPGASALHFATSARLIVLAGAKVHAIELSAHGDEHPIASVLDVTATDARDDLVLAGTGSGTLSVLSSDLQVLGSASICRDRVRAMRFIPGSDLFAFSCQDPVAGIARYHADRRDVTIIDTFATRGFTQVATDAAGRYVLLVDESLTAYVYDISTRLLTRYDGNAGIPNYVSAPTADFNRVLVGDVNGTVRVWDAPTGDARVVVQAPEPVFGLAFSDDGKSLLSGGSEGILRHSSTSQNAVRELRGHHDVIQAVRLSPDGKTALSISQDRTARTWHMRDLTAGRLFAGHRGMIEDAEFVEDGERIVSVGDDGQVLVWSPHGNDESVLFRTPDGYPLVNVERLTQDRIVIMDAHGTIWEVSTRGGSKKVRRADGAVVTTLRASLRGNRVAIGTETGVVTIYDTASWQAIKTAKAQGSIRQIQFDPEERDLVIASEPGRAQYGHVQLVALGQQRTVRWREVVADARDVAYSPDGNVVALVCADGGTWLYNISRDTWFFARDHASAALSGRFSPDGRQFASSDIRGAVIIRTLAATGSPQ